MTRMIAFMRHAQAGSGRTDHERPLTAAGRQQAQRAAQSLTRYFEAPVTVVASSARRTQETALALATALGADTRVEEGLYTGDETEVLGCAQLDEDVIVVGHAPVIAYAALELASRIDTETVEKVGQRGCPTATAFIFREDEETGGEPTYTWVDTLITPTSD